MDALAARFNPETGSEFFEVLDRFVARRYRSLNPEAAQGQTPAPAPHPTRWPSQPAPLGQIETSASRNGP